MSPEAKSEGDIAVLAAAAATDYPLYILDDLIASGGMPEVYAALDKFLGGRPLSRVPLTDITRVVLDVIEQRTLRRFGTPDIASEPEQSVGSLFVAEGWFPDPKIVLEEHPEQPLHTNARLGEIDGVMKRWKAGELTSSEAMSAVRKIVKKAEKEDCS